MIAAEAMAFNDKTQTKTDNSENANFPPACGTAARPPPATIFSQPLAPPEPSVQLPTHAQTASYIHLLPRTGADSELHSLPASDGLRDGNAP